MLDPTLPVVYLHCITARLQQRTACETGTEVDCVMLDPTLRLATYIALMTTLLQQRTTSETGTEVEGVMLDPTLRLATYIAFMTTLLQQRTTSETGTKVDHSASCWTQHSGWLLTLH